MKLTTRSSFGGGNVLELARSGADLNAVVCLHLQTTMPAKKGVIKAAVFVSHGSKDPVAPKADRDALEAEMDGAGKTLRCPRWKERPGRADFMESNSHLNRLP